LHIEGLPEERIPEKIITDKTRGRKVFGRPRKKEIDGNVRLKQAM
jgi:hypothetical protein